MKVTLEQIDSLRERANVSYEDAKEALEKFDGDMVEALVHLEKEKKIKAKNKAECRNQFLDKLKGIIKKGNDTKLVIKGTNGTVLNIPITLAIIATIFATPFVIIGLLVALLTKHKISIKKTDGEDLEVNKVFDKMADAVDNITSENSADKNNTDKKQEE
ncbi:DUF4342 domain-containing protein [Wukongibacter sp. M2B1]|uniref:DUF4342 domain-containing protein n=1 Tax=Wukongibacter sp. M2B1 TaxID=3088895 RepID=UPI003D7AAA35